MLPRREFLTASAGLAAGLYLRSPNTMAADPASSKTGSAALAKAGEDVFTYPQTDSPAD